jgi:hypothetical protein
MVKTTDFKWVIDDHGSIHAELIFYILALRNIWKYILFFFPKNIFAGWKPTVYSYLLYPEEHMQAIHTGFEARWIPVKSARALCKMLLRPTSTIQLCSVICMGVLMSIPYLSFFYKHAVICIPKVGDTGVLMRVLDFGLYLGFSEHAHLYTKIR